MSINKNCKEVFILNDKEGVNFYSKWSKKIKYLPDPIYVAPPSDLNICEYHNIDLNTMKFLHIGSLGRYKGAYDIFNAIKNIDFINNLHFLFVGRMENKLFTSLQNLRKQLSRNCLKNVISIRNEFISENDFSAKF